MKDCDVEIGKTYRIREWDDMADEFGLFEDDQVGWESIRTEGAPFTPEMRELCGMEFTVKDKRLVIPTIYDYLPEQDYKKLAFYRVYA